MDSSRNICDLHRDSKYVQQFTRYRKGTVIHEVVKPTFKSTLAGGPASVFRFWCFFCFLYDIGTEYAANAFITGEFWPSTEEQAVRILTLMATAIPMFQAFFTEYTTGPLFEFMMYQGPRPRPEVIWNFTKEGVCISPTASYVVTEFSNFVRVQSFGLIFFSNF